jgi:very-short-patch-repair endonuclease
MDPELLGQLLGLAAAQHGVATRTQARALGCTRFAVDHLIGSGRWSEVTDEVLRLNGAPRTVSQELMEAVLDGGPGAALSHLSAGHWWGLSGCALRPIQIVRVSSSVRSTELARIHRVRELPRGAISVLRGVPVVRPELLALQLFAVCTWPRAQRLTDRLWSKRLLSGPSIGRFLDRYGRRGRNGTAGLRVYLEERGSDYVPPASGLESRFMELMASAGIPMRRQVDLGEDEWTGRVDFVHAVEPLVVEIQSEAFHTALGDAQADERRFSALRAAGFVVLPVSDTLVFASPMEVVRLVRRALREAARRTS